MNARLLIDLAIVAAAGYFLVRSSKSAESKDAEENQAEEVGLSGVYTPALDFSTQSSGQGLPGYVGVEQFVFRGRDKDQVLDQVKDNAARMQQKRSQAYMQPARDNPYRRLDTGLSTVVPQQKTFGVCLPGTAVPGTSQAM